MHALQHSQTDQQRAQAQSQLTRLQLLPLHLALSNQQFDLPVANSNSNQCDDNSSIAPQMHFMHSLCWIIAQSSSNTAAATPTSASLQINLAVRQLSCVLLRQSLSTICAQDNDSSHNPAAASWRQEWSLESRLQLQHTLVLLCCTESVTGESQLVRLLSDCCVTMQDESSSAAAAEQSTTPNDCWSMLLMALSTQQQQQSIATTMTTTQSLLVCLLACAPHLQEHQLLACIPQLASILVPLMQLNGTTASDEPQFYYTLGLASQLVTVCLMSLQQAPRKQQQKQDALAIRSSLIQCIISAMQQSYCNASSLSSASIASLFALHCLINAVTALQESQSKLLVKLLSPLIHATQQHLHQLTQLWMQQQQFNNQSSVHSLLNAESKWHDAQDNVVTLKSTVCSVLDLIYNCLIDKQSIEHWSSESVFSVLQCLLQLLKRTPEDDADADADDDQPLPDEDDDVADALLANNNNVRRCAQSILTSLQQCKLQFKSQQSSNASQQQSTLTQLTLAAIMQQFTQQQQVQSQSQSMHEACLTAMNCLAPESLFAHPTVLQFETVLQHYLLPALRAAHDAQLQMTSLHLASRLIPLLLQQPQPQSQQLVTFLLQALFSALCNNNAESSSVDSVRVRLCAVRAVTFLHTQVDNDEDASTQQQSTLASQLISAAAQIMTSLCQLMQQEASESTSNDDSSASLTEDQLHDVLNLLELLLQSLLPSNGIGSLDTTSTMIVQQLSPLLLQLWSRQHKNRLLSSCILNCLRVLIHSSSVALVFIAQLLLPICAQQLQSYIGAVAQSSSAATQQAAAEQLAALESCLELLQLVVKDVRQCSDAQVIASLQQPLNALLPIVLQFLLLPSVAEERSLLNTGLQTLTAFLMQCCHQSPPPTTSSSSAHIILTLPDDQLQAACHVVCLALNPASFAASDHLDSASEVCTCLTAVLSFHTRLSQDAIRALLIAALQRLLNAEYPLLLQSLLCVFARLILQARAVTIVQLLLHMSPLTLQRRRVAHRIVPAGQKYATAADVSYVNEPVQVSALELLLTKWLIAQSDIHSLQSVRLTLLALLSLLSLCDDHVGRISVQGNALPAQPTAAAAASSGRVTRSKAAAAAPVQYEQLSAHTAMLRHLLTEYQSSVTNASHSSDPAQHAAIAAAQHANAASLSDEEDDDESGVESDSSSAGLNSSAGMNTSMQSAASNSRPASKRFTALSSRLDDEDDAAESDIVDDESPVEEADPLCDGVDLLSEIPRQLRQAFTTHAQQLSSAAQQLTPKEQSLLHQVLQAQQ